LKKCNRKNFIPYKGKGTKREKEKCNRKNFIPYKGKGKKLSLKKLLPLEKTLSHTRESNNAAMSRR
jgi:hypothetical protein